MIIGILVFFVLGLIFGSFLNSLLFRFYYNLSLWERSFCPECKKILKIKDLIPLFSFFMLKGRCRFCRQKISNQYWLVELATGFLFALFFIKYQSLTLFLVRDLFFIFVLIFIFVFDLKHYLILDKVIYPAIIIGLFINLYLGLSIVDLLIGFVVSGVFFFLQYILTKGQGIGLGDVKLGLLIGVMLGWPLILPSIALAYIIGGLTALILLLFRRKKFGDVLPLGTFLSVATVIVLLWGDKILSFYF